MKLKILAIRESRGFHILNPLNAAEAVTEEAMADRECFWVLHLATSHRVIEKEIVAIGILSSALIHPREVFKKAIVNSAASIITVHNHPSGSLSPSPEDGIIWQRLSEAGKIIGIEVLDHIIVGPAGGYYSHRENSRKNWKFP